MAIKQIRIVGAGWAGLAAAVAAVQQGWQVELFEMAPAPGGRARSLPQQFGGHPLDNGQHVLIGAYTDTLALMRTVGLTPEALLHRSPLNLTFPGKVGLRLPDWPAPWNVLAGIAGARGWRWQDKARLLAACWQWQRQGFACDPGWTVTQLCARSALPSTVVQQLIEPLCLSALNTACHEASASLFLRVLRDAMLGERGSADLLMPTTDLSALLPDACVAWLRAHGAQVHLGHRITTHDVAAHVPPSAPPVWVLACSPWEAARLAAPLAPAWAQTTERLAHNPITTVYLHCSAPHFRGLPSPMVALHCDATQPAQFVFDRGFLTQQPGLLACVVSASEGERAELAHRVQRQVAQQLGLSPLHIVQTVVEKRATMACTPHQQRPPTRITDTLYACGDYVMGPYPSTLEGAVRSGQQVIAQLRDR